MTPREVLMNAMTYSEGPEHDVDAQLAALAAEGYVIAREVMTGSWGNRTRVLVPVGETET